MAKRLSEMPELQGLRDAVAFVELAKDAKRIGKVVDAFVAAKSEAEAAIAENNRQYDDLLKRERALADAQDKLSRKVREIEGREDRVSSREAHASDEMQKAQRFAASEQDRVARREKVVDGREKAVKARETELKAREVKVAKREQDTEAREQAVARREKRVAEASRLMAG